MVIEQHWDTNNLFISGETSGRWAIEWNDTFTKEEVATLTYGWVNDDGMYLCLLNEAHLTVEELYSLMRQLNMRQVELGPRLRQQLVETLDWPQTVDVVYKVLREVGLVEFANLLRCERSFELWND